MLKILIYCFILKFNFKTNQVCLLSLNFILYFYIENEDEEGKKRNFMKILSFTKKDWPIIVFGTVSLTLCSVGESFIPLILGKIVSG